MEFTNGELYQMEKLLVKKLEEDKKQLEEFLENGNKLEDVSWMFDTEDLESALDKVRKLK